MWLQGMGILVFSVFVVWLWLSLSRPPMRTLGETRLWYSLFMMISGWWVYRRWRYTWILPYSQMVATVFMVINLWHPEWHDKTLMPALQSAWFVPHVTVYIFSYSLFGCAFLMAVCGLYRRTPRYLPATDRLVMIGYAFLTAGMLSGCIWAKQAWGLHWTWDPKETWAAATWCACLVYVHLRHCHSSVVASDAAVGNRLSRSEGWAYVWLIVIFLWLQMCWYGVSFLPSAAGSLHTYAG